MVGRVDRHHERVTVTVHGRPSAVLLSPDDLAALEETIAVLSDDAAVRQLAASDAELAWLMPCAVADMCKTPISYIMSAPSLRIASDESLRPRRFTPLEG